VKRIRRHDKFLARLCAACDCPDPEELEGLYLVKMLTGPLPDLTRLGHRKGISDGSGVNILRERIFWGYFEVGVNYAGGEPDSILLDYDHYTNFFPLNRVRDYVRRDAGGVYVGKFHVVLFNRPIFLGYFRLSKAVRRNWEPRK
jgi:hypothetical protein